jgi:hypothetical protein
VSALTALVLLTYTLIRIVVIPSFEAEFTLLGLLLSFEINTNSVMLTLAAGLAIAGADWLIRSHPNVKEGQIRPEHWVIPGLAALGAGAIISRLPEGPTFWIGLILTATLLITLLMAEFVVVSSDDPRHEMASIGLSTLAYLLLIGAFFAMRSAGLRAVFAVPLAFIASAAVSWRLLRLSKQKTGAWRHASLVGLVTAQTAWGLHYWQLTPLRGALLLGLTIYLWNGFALLHREGQIVRTRIIEFVIVLAISLTAIFALT